MYELINTAFSLSNYQNIDAHKAFNNWPKNLFADDFIVRFDYKENDNIRQHIVVVPYVKDIKVFFNTLCPKIINMVNNSTLVVKSVSLDTDANMIVVKFA